MPPASVPTTSARNPTRPISPTATVDWVRLYTCRNVATIVNCDPNVDAASPSHSRRKSRDARSGVTSTAIRRANPPIRDVRVGSGSSLMRSKVATEPAGRSGRYPVPAPIASSRMPSPSSSSASSIVSGGSSRMTLS